MAQQNFPAPPDVAKAPEEAMVTESGLASKILTPGSGSETPSSTSKVTVHYTGWKSSDGSMFDSSRARGEPTSFPLNQVIPGWTEGLQLMVEGESRRFWIPAELAYGPEVPGSGRPGGQLVFDVELLKFEKGPEPVNVPAEAVETDGGVAYVITEEGEGDPPTAEQQVQFHFDLLAADGTSLQSSRESGPQTAPMASLPPFFSEVFAVMPEGAAAEAYIPGKMIGAQDDVLKCKLQVLQVKDPVPAPPVPADVAAIPDHAEKTDSGLAYTVLSSGEGGATPTAASTVTVHYTGWETNGEMFDSSVVRGEPTTFPLAQVIKGWTEGVQLMHKGDTFRFWIPQELAYGPKQEGSGRPGGLLVFDVELIDF